MDRILVVDLGGQYAHLIANRLRRLGVLADISLPETTAEDIKKDDVKGIILSGGPSSVYDKDSPGISSSIILSGLPILGICYGHQLLAYKLGGSVEKGDIKEYGAAKVRVNKNPLFEGLMEEQDVWMSHGDIVIKLPIGFNVIASSENCPVAAMEDEKRNLYGLQFHPEVTHTVNGIKILENFALRICGCKKEWDPDNYLDKITKDIIRLTQNRKVFLLVSGGVDSVVLFTLLNKTLGQERILGLHVDTGLMRMNEREEVENAMHTLGFNNLKSIDASNQCFATLKDIINPEEKRRIIGELFINIINQYSDRLLNSNDWIVAQGTIYPDTIETKGTKNADLIKTHHNRVPKMQMLIEEGKVIEPLSHLYKDEVRIIGKILGLPQHMINRHPFPGPGFGVRILCSDGIPDDVSLIQKKIKSARNDVIILPIKSVGVQGDSRTYKHPAFISGWSEWDALEKISTELTNNITDINRVLLMITKKEGDIKSLKRTITRDRVELLQGADKIVEEIIRKHDLYEKIWQMPVVLAPLSIIGGEAIILRPVDSQEAMTASFSKLSKQVIEEMGQRLIELSGIDIVFYDITNKPPGTIEWE